MRTRYGNTVIQPLTYLHSFWIYPQKNSSSGLVIFPMSGNSVTLKIDFTGLRKFYAQYFCYGGLGMTQLLQMNT